MATKGQAASHSLGQSKSLDLRVKRKGVAQFQQQIVQLKYFLLQPGATPLLAGYHMFPYMCQSWQHLVHYQPR